MATEAQKQMLAALLNRYGQTYAAELGIDIEKNTPSPLFMLLCASLLYSARIRADAATQALKALFAKGWTTPQKMADTAWEERVKVLNANGYARYDESTARMLGDTVDLLLSEYDGDLRKLRDAAERKPSKERRLLKAFKGVGDVGVNIFFREAQLAWAELYPFADKPSLNAAKRLGLAETTEELAAMVDREDFPRLVAALVRIHLANAYDDIAAAEAQG
jgi:endonuclease III